MRLSLTTFILSGALVFGTLYPASRSAQIRAAEGENGGSKSLIEAAADEAEMRRPDVVRYILQPDQSRFMIDANSAGLLWFLGHNHHIAAGEFTGEVELTPGTLAPASLQMLIKTESLKETGEHFTDKQKEIITNSMHKDVLETAKFPEAVFKSSNVTVKKKTGDKYEARVEGRLTLHGVTRNIMIPTQVTLDGDTMRASGRFEIDRDDFKIKTHSVKWGTIRVDDDMKLSFDIVARRR